MKDVTPALSEALPKRFTTLCRLWTIKRVDGQVTRFTDHDRKVVFGGQTYSATRSFVATAIQTQINSAASDMDVTILPRVGGVEYTDLERGMYDDAEVTVTIVDWRDPTGSAMVFAGRVRSAVLPNRISATLALVGTLGQSERPITEKYSANCRAQFGDERCKFNLATVTAAIEVTTVASVQSFTAGAINGEPAHRYARGRIEWTGGDNTGIVSDVADSDAAGGLKLLLKPPYPVQPGDTGNLIRGCQKTVAACTAYNNLPNMRAEPYVPGEEGLNQ